ncbi:hypothetical protein [Haloarcula laminariae]|uniref:hypothetical protein n=1 Tax=Haloarcula laminariae TaxID=2961577 RepID=UPI0024054055|nr:hypothetical protein [Halomicroarcula sp. FL173]
MATAGPAPLAQRASHGAVSLAAGFLAGLALFLAVGASAGDAVFSALALAALVAVTRTLLRPAVRP